MTKSNNNFRQALDSAEARAHITTSPVVNSLLECLDTPRSLSVFLLYKYNEHEQLRTYEINPIEYNCPFKFRNDYQASKLLSKSTFLNEKRTKSTKDAALEKFFECEKLNKVTNSRFNRNPSLDSLSTASNFASFHKIQRKILEVLGESPDPRALFEKAGWGPGVSTFIKGDKLGASTKFHNESGITQQWYDFVYPLMQHCMPMWVTHIESHRGWNITNSAQLSTVPKNSKTDRVIGVEPGINLFFQKGIGAQIRKNLKAVGIDLKRQQEKHAKLAKQGSITDDLCTVDFSSASDLIASALVRELLPLDWYLTMDACRTKSVIHEGRVHINEKFSSMGNGFTFELESLIFYSTACAVVPERDHAKISVFGDDVILPSKYYESFSSLCDYLGFKVNLKKSYSSGYFRESCGSYFFDGIDCKPIYIKDKLHDIKALYKLANSIRRVAHRRNSHYGCDVSLLPAWFKVVNNIPNSLKLYGPDGYGDDYLVGNSKEYLPCRQSVYDGEAWCGYSYPALASISETYHVSGTGLKLARLWTICDRSHELFDLIDGVEPPFRQYNLTAEPLVVGQGLSPGFFDRLLGTDKPMPLGHEEDLKAAIRIKQTQIFVPMTHYCVGEWL